MAPRLTSVIVPVLDAVEHLPFQLDALARQEYEGAWEVVIADNGSRDGSLRVAQDWLAKLASGRLVLATGAKGPSHARNAGAAAARGDFLVFCDADDVASPTWVAGMAEAATRGDLVAGGVGADLLNDEPASSWHAVAPRQRAIDGLRFLMHTSGTSMGVWSDVFRALGGFDDRTRVGEDIEFSWRAQLSGYRLELAPEAIVHERYRRRIRDLARQHLRYGEAGPLLYRRFRDQGLPRSGLRGAALGWASLVSRSPALLWSVSERGRWALEAALSLGRVAGSIRQRVLYL